MPRGRRYRLSPRLSTEVERGRSRVVCAVQSLPYNTVVSSLSKIQFNTDLKNHAEDARRRRGPRPAVSSGHTVAPGCPPCVSRDARRQHSRFQTVTRHTRAVAVESSKPRAKGAGASHFPARYRTPRPRVRVCEGYRERCTRHTVLRGSAYTQMTGERPVPGRGIICQISKGSSQNERPGSGINILIKTKATTLKTTRHLNRGCPFV